MKKVVTITGGGVHAFQHVILDKTQGVLSIVLWWNDAIQLHKDRKHIPIYIRYKFTQIVFLTEATSAHKKWSLEKTCPSDSSVLLLYVGTEFSALA